MIYRGVGDLYLNLELRNVNSTLTTKDAKARLEDLTNKVLVKWITAIALQPACGDGGSCWTDYKTQAVEDKGFGWFITYIRNNVSWLKFHLPANGKAQSLCAKQSTLLCKPFSFFRMVLTFFILNQGLKGSYSSLS